MAPFAISAATSTVEVFLPIILPCSLTASPYDRAIPPVWVPALAGAFQAART